MFLSVHMTTFCQAESGWVTNAISSVLGQSHRDFEFIVYDDGSYDGTAAVLNDFAKADARLRIIRGEANLNIISKSLGTCFLARNPRAEAITWMFDDNVLQEDALAVLSEEMVQSGADLVYGQTCIKVNDGKSWDIGTRAPEEIGRNDAINRITQTQPGEFPSPTRSEKTFKHGRIFRDVRLLNRINLGIHFRVWSLKPAGHGGTGGKLERFS